MRKASSPWVPTSAERHTNLHHRCSWPQAVGGAGTGTTHPKILDQARRCHADFPCRAPPLGTGAYDCAKTAFPAFTPRHDSYDGTTSSGSARTAEASTSDSDASGATSGEEDREPAAAQRGTAWPSPPLARAALRQRSLGAQAQVGPRRRRNSQRLFAARAQTCIVLDWDDTLYPSTHLAALSESEEQTMDSTWSPACEQRALDLVRLANRLGKVVVVTLADKGWVERCCRDVCPRLGAVLNELNIKVVSAKVEGAGTSYAMMKRMAISAELHAFYSQYERQSWKNVISIGDSNFERFGTMQATADYLWERQLAASRDHDSSTRRRSVAQLPSGEIDVGGHIHKVRTKTLKMVQSPSIQELALQIGMLQQWLPLIVSLDRNFDMELSDLSDPEQIRAVGVELRRDAGASHGGAGRRGNIPFTSPGCARTRDIRRRSVTE